MNLITNMTKSKCTREQLLDENARVSASLRLTDADFANAAGLLGVETAAIRAVLEVETGNKGGFLAPGKPTLLFEGHVFWSQLSKCGLAPADYQKGNEDILYPKWTKAYYKGGMGEYERLERARVIHREAADSSASWGLAQIMGFNYGACGCKSVDEFVRLMSKNEGRQLELFVRFLQGNKWDRYLKELDWKEFARHYNGPAYEQNHYDEKTHILTARQDTQKLLNINALRVYISKAKAYLNFALESMYCFYFKKVYTVTPISDVARE